VSGGPPGMCASPGDRCPRQRGTTCAPTRPAGAAPSYGRWCRRRGWRSRSGGVRSRGWLRRSCQYVGIDRRAGSRDCDRRCVDGGGAVSTVRPARAGYDRYGAHGGDIGAGVTGRLGATDASHVIGTLVNSDRGSLALAGEQFPIPEHLTEDDRAVIARARKAWEGDVGIWICSRTSRRRSRRR
jgi:hypothetical protein